MIPQLSSSPQIVVLADKFLDWVQRERSADTFEWYRYPLERFAKKFPDLQSGELKPLHVQEWLNEYPDLSRTSRRNYVRSVKTCLKWAVQQGYIERNLIDKMPVPNAEHREITILADEFERMLAAIPDLAFRDLVTVTSRIIAGRGSACRPQEKAVDVPQVGSQGQTAASHRLPHGCCVRDHSSATQGVPEWSVVSEFRRSPVDNRSSELCMWPTSDSNGEGRASSPRQRDPGRVDIDRDEEAVEGTDLSWKDHHQVGCRASL
jgi:hypothetical protein